MFDRDYPRYVIGIDLGTTNSSVSFVDTDASMRIQAFHIPQIVDVGVVKNLPSLPSFCYIASPHELAEGALKLQWHSDRSYVVGLFARQRGGEVPTRSVQSAKSWLCHSALNRRDKLLPIEADESIDKISPIDATARYLKHIKDSWDYVMARKDQACVFEDQEVIVTVPASFDEVARVLTVEAAKQAGFGNVTVLEEPQAAFYAWIAHNEGLWKSKFHDGDTILVCDVGGGTTDFSLISVKDEGFQRMSVGDHLLLGGDNIDMAIAHHLEAKLSGNELSSMQWLQLRHQARKAKEVLLSGEQGSFSAVIQGSGAHVIGGSRSVEVTAEELRSLLLNGFFGQYDRDEALKLTKSSGVRSMGLPYEAEPSVTKHLAKFLSSEGEMVRPDYILFHGGTMKPQVFRDAVTGSLSRWFHMEPPEVLASPSLDLAVSRGATYFGKARRGHGVRISSGSARTYYLSVEVTAPNGDAKHQALTLLSRGSREGTTVWSDHTCMLMPNAPVSFQLWTSHTRLNDNAGDFIDIDNENMHALPPVRTVLRYGARCQEKIPIKLGITFTEIGTLEVWLSACNTEHRWSLEFQLKTASGQDDDITMSRERQGVDETLDSETLSYAEECVRNAYIAKTVKPVTVIKSLETIIAAPRDDWSSGILRGLWNVTMECAQYRTTTPDHESRWWNLAGFLLRPGFGHPFDDFRIKDLWKIILQRTRFDNDKNCKIQQWVCWRRIAGGLGRGQQKQLVATIIPTIVCKNIRKSQLYEYSEKIRAAAAMERIDIKTKIILGDAIISRIISGQGLECDFWALARIGARCLLYGSAADIIPRDICSSWIEKLLNVKESKNLQFVLAQLSRKTDQREINLSNDLIDSIRRRYKDIPRLQKLLDVKEQLTTKEKNRIFGDSLPIGLSIEL